MNETALNVSSSGTVEDGLSIVSYTFDDDGAALLDDYFEYYYYVGPIELASFAVTHIASGISFLSAICIFLECRISTVAIHRILFWLSLGLMLASFASLFGTLPLSDENFWGAHGNHVTCTLQGFCLQLGGSLSVLWDIGLSISFILIVKYSWRDPSMFRYIQVLHAIIWPVALGIAVPPLFLQLYNPDYDLCGIAAFPNACRWDDIECIRGNPHIAYVFFFVNIGLMSLAIVISMSSMVTLYCHVRNTENRSNQYSFESSAAARSTTQASQVGTGTAVGTRRPPSATSGDDRRRSRAVATQGIFYSGTIILANVPFLLSYLTVPAWYYIFCNATRHLYGFFYLMVFLRMQPKCQTPYGRLMHRIFVGCCCCTGCMNLCRSVAEKCQVSLLSSKKASSRREEAPQSALEQSASIPETFVEEE